MELDKREWKYRFATNLRIIMVDRGFTQRSFADALDVNESTVSRYLSGLMVPTGPMITKILTVLRCDAIELGIE